MTGPVMYEGGRYKSNEKNVQIILAIRYQDSKIPKNVLISLFLVSIDADLTGTKD